MGVREDILAKQKIVRDEVLEKRICMVTTRTPSHPHIPRLEKHDIIGLYAPPIDSPVLQALWTKLRNHYRFTTDGL